MANSWLKLRRLWEGVEAPGGVIKHLTWQTSSWLAGWDKDNVGTTSQLGILPSWKHTLFLVESEDSILKPEHLVYSNHSGKELCSFGKVEPALRSCLPIFSHWLKAKRWGLSLHFTCRAGHAWSHKSKRQWSWSLHLPLLSDTPDREKLIVRVAF